MTPVDRSLLESAPSKSQRPECLFCSDPLKPRYKTYYQRQAPHAFQTLPKDVLDALASAGFPIREQIWDPDAETGMRFSRRGMHVPATPENIARLPDQKVIRELAPEPFDNPDQEKRVVARTWDGTYGWCGNNAFCNQNCAQNYAGWHARNYTRTNKGVPIT